MSNMIEIIGERSSFDYDEVKRDVVCLNYGGKKNYYWKSSREIVKINGRYYRKSSPLVVKTIDKTYELKKDAIKLGDGSYSRRGSHRVAEFNGEFFNKAHLVEIGGVTYKRSDPRVVRTQNEGEQLRKDCVKLSSEIYGGSDVWVHKGRCYDGSDINEYASSRYVKTSRGWCSRADTVPVLDTSKKGLAIIPMYRLDFEREKSLPYSCFVGVNNPRNPLDLRNFRAARILAKDEDKVVNTGDGYVIPKYYEEEFNVIWKKYYKAYIEKDVKALKKLMDANFSDRDSDENVATIVKKDVIQHPGGRFVRGMDFRYSKQLNSDLSLTGGLGYTFGIELECSAGEIPTASLESLNVALAGDGSVGANEYVSGILHGTYGMEEAGKIVSEFRKSCLVDDRCGVHVHVGGTKSRFSTTPKFGKKFAIDAIKLGTMLEGELYMMSPVSRTPNLKYCAGIAQKYSKINDKNWRSHLGDFVFGNSHTWEDGDEKRELGRWTTGRYKWLNLVNCCSKSRQNTIEIRIWPGTTSYNKLRGYILISLAFVNFIDNHSNEIWSKESLSLKDIIVAAYGEESEITESLIYFVEKRKQSFGRTLKSIYNN